MKLINLTVLALISMMMLFSYQDISDANVLENRTLKVKRAIKRAVQEAEGDNSIRVNDVTSDHLAAITLLEIDSKNVDSLQDGDFAGLSSLTTLDLSENNLTSLPAGIFDELSSLELLYLSENNLTSLPAGIFDELSSLEKLFLNENTKLVSLPSNVFHELSSVKTISLSSTSKSDLPSDMFDGLSTLEFLSFANSVNGSLTSLPDGIFDGLSSMIVLNLYNCAITSLPDGIFDDMSDLISLKLSDNAITSLPDGIFANLSSLSTLWFTNNRIPSFPDGIFEGMSSLSRLYMIGNVTRLMPVTLSLEKVAEGEFKATAHSGAPFSMRIPITVTNGTVSDDETHITIETGTLESSTFTVTRTDDTTAAVTVDIGDPLPNLPITHSGYIIAKSEDLPLEVIGAVGAAPSSTEQAPEETVLLSNYPNPFNPETWIPYQLANPSTVQITIYNTRGVVVRHLDLGHQPAGYYTSRSRAAHWDGKNATGERIASGIYFYRFEADNISLLRKMVILK